MHGNLALMLKVSFIALALALTGAQTVPVRRLGAPVAASTEALGPTVLLRALSDNRVLVNDVVNRRVLLFSADLRTFKVVIDSMSPSTRVTVSRAGTLIPYKGDTTLYVDFPAQSLAVIDPNGAITRTVAAPKGGDVIYLAGGGTVGVDPAGRLLYRVSLRGRRDSLTDGTDRVVLHPADSAAIVRADFETRTIDTLIRVLTPHTAYSQTTPNPRGGPPSLKMVMSLIPVGDEWTVLPDGTVAIVRAHDYHIDWVSPDGTRRSTPKMPFDWRKFTDDDKHHFIDSVTAAFDDARAHPQTTPTGLPIIVPDLGFVPLDSAPEYYPPVQPGGVKHDAAGNVWILPRTSSHAQGGALYDVVNRDGKIVERVQLPANRTILGFGSRGAVFLAVFTGGHTTIERAE